jgi:hypothetical protein
MHQRAACVAAAEICAIPGAKNGGFSLPYSRSDPRTKAHKLGVCSEPPAWQSWTSALVKPGMIEHVGENPSVAQKMLIDRAVILSLRFASFDQKIINEGAVPITLHDTNYLIAWQNA